MSADILIRQGESLTTPDGETYATAQRDIARFAPMLVTDWLLADGSTPSRGDPIPDGVLEFEGENIAAARINGKWREFKNQPDISEVSE